MPPITELRQNQKKLGEDNRQWLAVFRQLHKIVKTRIVPHNVFSTPWINKQASYSNFLSTTMHCENAYQKKTIAKAVRKPQSFICQIIDYRINTISPVSQHRYHLQKPLLNSVVLFGRQVASRNSIGLPPLTSSRVLEVRLTRSVERRTRRRLI